MNQRTAKQKPSVAYFFFSELSQKQPWIGFLAFKAAFKKYKVRKVLGTNVDLKIHDKMGFAKPTSLDEERIEILRDLKEGAAGKFAIQVGMKSVAMIEKLKQ